jgi:regulator-associated protein of mTOR
LTFETSLQERHDAGDELPERRRSELGGLVSKWRQKDKLKTTAVALVLCLNIGVDPPDVIKISPCARLECWVDPLSMQPAKALETIGKHMCRQQFADLYELYDCKLMLVQCCCVQHLVQCCAIML